MDLLAADCGRSFKEIQLSPFSGVLPGGEVIFNNDEIIFDSVQVNVPSLSIQKYPFAEYHTSNDTPDQVREDDLSFAHNAVVHMINILERDAIYRFVHPVPFWMSRFDLYSDALKEGEQYRLKFEIVYQYLDGKRSVLQIAQLMDLPFEAVYEFIKKMEQHQLVQVVHKHPWRLINRKDPAC
jgi:aminopeptidase-like protein